jgi:glycosyltransferase involved in cell wall biosynthesis
MRIGMILDQTFPPDPRVENEAVTLIEQGHQVFLFCLSYDGKHSEEEINGIQVKRYASSHREYQLSALAYTVPFYTNSLSKKIQDFIQKNQVEVLHIHDMRVAGAVFKANKKHELSTVLDLHENRPEIMKFYPHLQKFPGKYLISLSKWKQKEESFVQRASKVIVVTEEAKQELTNRAGVAMDKIVVVPNSVRKSFYKSSDFKSDILQKYQDHFVVLYVGDTNLRRGLLTAIEASKKLSQEISNYKLVIVGSNTTDTVLKQKVRELNVESFVDFEGWQDLSLFPSYIQSSRICISPLHRNPHHDTTYANKIFQYMSFGKPLVVSDATAQESIVKRSQSGLIHKAKDVQEYTNCILQLYQNAELAKKYGASGKQFIEQEFSWEQTSQDLIELYADI